MSPTLRKSLIALGAVILVGGGGFAYLSRGNVSHLPIEQMEGRKPKLVDPEPETFPTVGLVKSVGWAANEAPTAAQGLSVTRFATGLQHPRTIITLPNGDVLVAETGAPKDNGPGGITGFLQNIFMGFVGAGDPSPNRIVLLRDSKGTGVADQRFVLREGLSSPSGMAYGDGKLYIANHDAVLAFDYQPGATSLTGAPKKLMDLPPAGNHWMRNLVLSPDGKHLYVAIGSASNIGERGPKAEEGRAAIYEIDTASGHARRYAMGLRNANGMAWNPSTQELWTVVNERDQLGPDLVPDYLTNVPVGSHYGWPWFYWGKNEDNRVYQNTPEFQMPEFLIDYVRKPEYALGPHVAALGLAFVKGGEKMGAHYANGAFIARHGSWNRKPAAGYDVVFVRFDANGNPQGLPEKVLTGFLKPDGETHGRPTWLNFAQDGALLVSDDTAGIIWRVVAPGAAPAAEIKPVVVKHLPPQKDLNGDPEIQYRLKFKDDQKVQEN
ncbi:MULTISPECIES: PQQ-dependent sugar dehydrogenase [unclassified Novosphingobium]|uniref:PQQ-dependent sugar dehydrogenase n=1 Tax=unclassified Novosphingobium TaxID=2644732 RepID=UPI000868CEDF|nr:MULTISPECIES: sorbosone dehydrogenase family protein [unclassified Novosphingobium]MBN9142683.1 sorbosone dehydrogenase family protein [Novosphingobium sp.]MDR6705767.1 glucose/arabinose dehydrogenase [Novosphingobium sp. 1748]ODU85135.1 MAG: sorbosone dehydrogenase [Novosphingobium sp. SCN 63-17]OJX89087.1 MAG: sorbosone dehydrogenase [Novosphingobium sp. 63-713]